MISEMAEVIRSKSKQFTMIVGADITCNAWPHPSMPMHGQATLIGRFKEASLVKCWVKSGKAGQTWTSSSTVALERCTIERQRSNGTDAAQGDMLVY